MQAEIILIGLITACYLYWHSAQQVKEIALKATRQYCLTQEVQMLDDYIALNGYGLKRNINGKIHILRSYVFEFSATGNDRNNGDCIMLGRDVVTIRLTAHRFRND